MQIAILGAGNIGGTLGRKLAARGHHVVFGVRDPHSARAERLLDEAGRAPENVRFDTFEGAVAGAEVVVLAVPFSVAQELLAGLGSLEGRVLVDATNAIPAPPDGFASTGQAIAAWSPRARVVKAFNNTGWENLADPDYAGTAAQTFICGDDPQARQVAARLAREVGMEPVELGGLETAALAEMMARLWVGLARGTALGRGFAIQVLRRA